MNPTYDFTGQRARHGCELGHGLATARASAGHVDHCGYVASKHAVSLTRVAGAESAPHGVRVNARCPGPIHTAMIESIERIKSLEESDRERERLRGNIPAHRYGTVEGVAEAAAFS